MHEQQFLHFISNDLDFSV